MHVIRLPALVRTTILSIAARVDDPAQVVATTQEPEQGADDGDRPVKDAESGFDATTDEALRHGQSRIQVRMVVGNAIAAGGGGLLFFGALAFPDLIGAGGLWNSATRQLRVWHPLSVADVGTWLVGLLTAGVAIALILSFGTLTLASETDDPMLRARAAVAEDVVLIGTLGCATAAWSFAWFCTAKAEVVAAVGFVAVGAFLVALMSLTLPTPNAKRLGLALARYGRQRLEERCRSVTGPKGLNLQEAPDQSVVLRARRQVRIATVCWVVFWALALAAAVAAEGARLWPTVVASGGAMLVMGGAFGLAQNYFVIRWDVSISRWHRSLRWIYWLPSWFMGMYLVVVAVGSAGATPASTLTAFGVSTLSAAGWAIISRRTPLLNTLRRHNMSQALSSLRTDIAEIEAAVAGSA